MDKEQRQNPGFIKEMGERDEKNNNNVQTVWEQWFLFAQLEDEWVKWVSWQLKDTSFGYFCSWVGQLRISRKTISAVCGFFGKPEESSCGVQVIGCLCVLGRAVGVSP